jgi:sugar phosphate isomerase/epimerase
LKNKKTDVKTHLFQDKKQTFIYFYVLLLLMSEIKLLTTPFSIIKNPKELLYHSIFNRLISDSRKFKSIKKHILNFVDKKQGISPLDSDLKNYFDGFEINMFYHGLFSSTGKVSDKKIKLFKETYKKIYAVHGNYEAPIGSYNYHKLNFAKELDKEKTKLLIANLETAHQLLYDNKMDFKPIVFHGGYGDKKTALDNVVRNIEFCLNYNDKKNLRLTILLENLPKDNPNYVTTNVDELIYVKNKLDDPTNFGFCFDFGHAGSSAIIEEGENAHFRKQNEIIDALGHAIKHVHLNYNHSHKMKKEDVDEYQDISEIDWHAPFCLDDEEEKKEIENIFEKINKNTSVRENKLVTLEIFPKHYFPNSSHMKIEAFSHGYENKNQVIDNVKFIRDSFK